MKRKAFNKRIVSCIVAMALVLSCLVTVFAGTLVEFNGDGGNKTTTLRVTTTGSFTYTVTNATPIREYSMYIGYPKIGTLCTFEADAVCDEGTEYEAVFLYWKDVISGRIYSYERKIQFVASSRMHLRAEFVGVDESSHYLTYVNYGGTILKDGKNNRGASYPVGTIVMPPSDTDLPGFTFTGWTKYPQDVANDPSDQVIYPQYTVNEESYTVTLTDDSYASGAGTYSNFQTVNLKAEEKNGSGQSFSYWQDENGTIISYERNYSFRINYDVTLTPVFGEDVEPAPVIRISKVYRDIPNTKITFYAERSVPDTYTVISHGILLANGAGVSDIPLTTSAGVDSTTEKANVRKAYGNSNEQCGTFSLAKGAIGRNDPVQVRPFVIVKDADGKQFVVYGDEVRTTNASTD